MTRTFRTLGLATVVGLAAMLVGPSSADARSHKSPCAPAPKAGCGFSLRMPKLFQGCGGMKLPRLGHGRKATPCGSAAPATHYAPTSLMPSAPVPSYQGGMMPGYSSPSMPMPSAPGMMAPSYQPPGMMMPGTPAPPTMTPGGGMPPMPGMIPPMM